MRLFVAVYPPPEAIAHLDSVVAPMRTVPGLRWGALAQWHVTVCFLGEVADESLALLREQLAGVTARRPPLWLSLAGVGGFARARATRVVWVGVSGDVDGLVALSRDVATAARTAGVGVEDDRRPRPHLTLARVGRGGPGARRVEDSLSAYAGPPWLADHVVLVRSTLGPPLRHDPVETWALTGD